MKKMLSLILATIMALSLVACAGKNDTTTTGDTNEVIEKTSTSNKTKTYHILSGSAESEAVNIVFDTIVKSYQAEVNPDFSVEYESITSTADLWQKLQMYYTANTLPDIFAISNGTLSEEMIKNNKLVNITEALTEAGHLEDVVPSLVDYFTSEDGQMYMFPSTFSSEFFVYRKPVFEKYGLQVPATWEEFLDVCQKLKDNGEYAYVMRGADYVQFLRFASFPTWTTYGRDYVKGLAAGKYTYSEGDLSMYAAELLQKLGTSGYFVPGFESMTLSDVVDTFMSGTGAMMYANANYIYKLSELYDAGEIGWFAVPTVEGKQGTGSTIPTHGGKAWAVNADSYANDPVLQDFLKYFFDHVDQASYDTGVLSWYNTEAPAGALGNMMGDISKEMKKQEVSWISWDDRLTAATVTTVGSAASELAYGMITPEEYCQRFDQALAENGG